MKPGLKIKKLESKIERLEAEIDRLKNIIACSDSYGVNLDPSWSPSD